MRSPPCLSLSALVVCLSGCAGMGDQNVVVSSTALPAYTEKKYQQGLAQAETYVFMPGHHFPGTTVDHTLERLSFRTLAESLAQDLAKKNYFPARDLAGADLLLVVHWGVTTPAAKVDELLGRTTIAADTNLGRGGAFQHPTMLVETAPSDTPPPPDYSELASVVNSHVFDLNFQDLERRTDLVGGDMATDTIHLLGYAKHLRRLSDKPFMSTEEQTLRHDLETERYFVVVRAYDLKTIRNRKPRVVWTLYLNMRAPGQNFTSALTAMSTVAANYFGRETGNVETIAPKVRDGSVTIGEITIVGEK